MATPTSLFPIHDDGRRKKGEEASDVTEVRKGVVLVDSQRWASTARLISIGALVAVEFVIDGAAAPFAGGGIIARR